MLHRQRLQGAQSTAARTKKKNKKKKKRKQTFLLTEDLPSQGTQAAAAGQGIRPQGASVSRVGNIVSEPPLGAAARGAQAAGVSTEELTERLAVAESKLAAAQGQAAAARAQMAALVAQHDVLEQRNLEQTEHLQAMAVRQAELETQLAVANQIVAAATERRNSLERECYAAFPSGLFALA
jgi:hypothetical protein